MLALSPAQMTTVDMISDDPGVWLFHCHVSDHMACGMTARYQVLPARWRLPAVIVAGRRWTTVFTRQELGAPDCSVASGGGSPQPVAGGRGPAGK